MPNWTPSQLELFLAFFIPGFISQQIYSLYVSTDNSDLTKRLPTIVGYSAMHYAVTGWTIVIAPDGIVKYVVAYIVVFILPFFWPPIVLLVRDRERWSKIFWAGWHPALGTAIEAMLKPEDSPWDRVLDATARFIRIKLKSGTYVGGYFGPGSAVSTFPDPHEIYISRAYRLGSGGEFEGPIENTGIMIEASEIETLETIALQERESGGLSP